METVNATRLKNRLGEVLAQASVRPIAVERHGRVVAWLVPPGTVKRRAKTTRRPLRWSRSEEERVLDLCAGGDFRPSRWLRAGDPEMLAGVAVMLASVDSFDRTRMLVLAERLYPGMSKVTAFNRWLARSPVHATHFLPMLKARMRAASRI